MDKSAILVVGHGSRENSANRAFQRLVKQFAASYPGGKVGHAFLELAHPSIDKALPSLAAFSSTIIVLPLFLFASGHMKRDIPRILKKFQQQHPFVTVRLAKELGPDPLMARLAYERSQGLKGKPDQTWVLVIGRGAREKKVQADFNRLVRLYGKDRGFQKVQGCSMGLAIPSIEDSLQKIKHAQPSTLWVVPYLLFPGKLMVLIRSRMKAFAKAHPSIQVQVGSPMGFHPLLLKILHRRLKIKH